MSCPYTKMKIHNTLAVACDVCELKHQAGIAGAKHRRCGGSKDAQPRAKRAPKGGVRGTWKAAQP